VVNGEKRNGNPSEMERAPAGQFFAARATAAAPREPGLLETLASHVYTKLGLGTPFARAKPS
jgi:hypothetical protein